MSTHMKQDLPSDRLKRMPKVLRAYAASTEECEECRIPDSGLQEVLTFVAGELELLVKQRQLLGELHGWFLTKAPEHYKGCGLYMMYMIV